MVLLSFFLNILAMEVSLNRLLRIVHLLLSLTISLIHCSHFFLSNMEEEFWVKESSVGVLLGPVIIFCSFCGSRGVGVGDVEWNVFRFLRGRCCFIAATLASNVSGNDVIGRTSGMVLGGVGSKWKPFIFDGNPENRFFVINWDHDCFVVDVDGIEGLSWSPGSPVELDVKVSMLDEGSEEVELVVVGMHVDEDDSIVCAQGEDGRCGKSCAGELVVDGRHGCWG